jgi:hypothetical protein
MGESSPVSVKLDATHAVNRFVDHWVAVFTNGMQQVQATAASAFPAGVSDADIDNIRSNPLDVQHHSHDHPMSETTSNLWVEGPVGHALGLGDQEVGWELQMTWRSYWFDDPDGQRWCFIDDCQAACAYTQPVNNTQLEVSAKFGHPWFVNHCAQMPVSFSVALKDGEGNNLQFATPLVNFQLDSATGSGWQTH